MPLLVVQKNRVQHVGIGEHPARGITDVAAGVDRCVAVVRRGLNIVANGSELVRTQGLRGRDVQRAGGGVVQQRRNNWQLVRQRLARGGTRGQHHMFAVPRALRSLRLVLIELIDVADHCPLGPLSVAGRARRESHHVSASALVAFGDQRGDFFAKKAVHFCE